MLKALRTFGNFVPKPVVQRIIQGKTGYDTLYVETRFVTMLFADIEKFTTISENVIEIKKQSKQSKIIAYSKCQFFFVSNIKIIFQNQNDVSK